MGIIEKINYNYPVEVLTFSTNITYRILNCNTNDNPHEL